MECTRVQEIIFLYTDNELEERLVIAFEEHLVVCPGCARRIDYTQKLLSLLRRSCVRASAPERLRQRILTNLPHRRSQFPEYLE